MIYWRQQITIMADKRKKPREQVKLDRIMRLLFHLSHKTVVRLINGLFDEAFDPGQVKVVYGNGNMTGHDFSKLEADLLLKVETASGDCEYHIEFQTLHDSAMAVRMFRYGFNRALEAGRMAEAVEAGTLTLFFPRQLVIYLEENESIREQVELVLVFPDGQTFRYRVPVMRYWMNTPQDLTGKKLYALLPLQVFRWRKRLQALERSKLQEEEKRRRMAEAFNGLKETVGLTLERLRQLHDERELSGADLERLLEAMQALMNYLYNRYGQYEKLDEEVRQMLKPWIDPKVKRKALMEGRREGKLEGKIQGKIEGKIEVAEQLLRRGIMTPPEISEITGLPLEQVSRLHEENSRQ